MSPLGENLPLLVFGASGQVGDFLLPRLRAQGQRALAVSRQARADAPGLHWLRGDLDVGVPDLPTCAAVFSLGPLDRFAEWFDVAAPPVEAVVALSSTSAETKRGSPDAAERAIAERLRIAEARLHAAAAARGVACTVLRPTLLYGAGRDRSLSRLAQFALRTRLFPRVMGARGLRQPLHVDDLAAACLAAWRRPATEGRTLALGGGERLAFYAMLQRVRHSLGVHTVPLPVPARLPPRWLPRAWHGAAARLQADLVVDNAAAQRELAVVPRAFAPRPQDWRPAGSVAAPVAV